MHLCRWAASAGDLSDEKAGPFSHRAAGICSKKKTHCPNTTPSKGTAAWSRAASLQANGIRRPMAAHLAGRCLELAELALARQDIVCRSRGEFVLHLERWHSNQTLGILPAATQHPADWLSTLRYTTGVLWTE